MNNFETVTLQALAPASDNGAEQPRAHVDAAIAEAKALWESSRDGLYDFLGAIHEHAVLISGDPSALAQLSLLVAVQAATTRARKRLARASAQELILAAAMGLDAAHRSLRSKYKTVLEMARCDGVSADRETFNLWVRREGGLVAILRRAAQAARPDLDARGNACPASRPSARGGAISVLRAELLSMTVKGMSPIPMIDNAPPADTFIAVIYRADAASLVPCFWSDATTDVDAVLRNALRREESEASSLAAASNDAAFPAHQDPANREAA
jgi:hypothetical protein